MIKQNPFTSTTFTNLWCQHFIKNKVKYVFNFINNISFFKFYSIPLYINIGKNLTKGVSYILNNNSYPIDFKNKIFLIYDVPEYFNIEKNNNSRKLKKIKQYPGYLINLSKYESFDNYFINTFSKKSIQKFRRYNKRLETCFNISYKMYKGSIEKQEYNFIFNAFKSLLIKRFEDKKIANNNLNPNEWDFYYDVVYPLILENKASLFVIYNEETPIAIRLNYYSKSIVFDAITVFDIDYNKFHIGKISIMKILEWSFENKYEIFDFSKGYFDYKESWSDLKYNFEYHVYYNNRSIISNIIASGLSCFFRLKQYFRDKELNNKLHKLSFFLNNKKSNTINNNLTEINQEKISYNEAMLVEIDIQKTNYSFLKKYVYDFLFLNSEHIINIKIYNINKGAYLIRGANSDLILKTANT